MVAPPPVTSRAAVDSHDAPSTSSSKHTSASTSVDTSPQLSRDPSPIRPPPRAGSALSRPPLSTTRSRKHSYHDQSPSRTSRSTGPSPAALQRSLSASTTPVIPPTQQDQANTQQPQKPPLYAEGKEKDTPRWPVPTRLRSPPPTPQLGRPSAAPPGLRQLDTPAINLQRSTPPPQADSLPFVPDTESDELVLNPGMRTPSRTGTCASTLETVQEVSLPSSPLPGIGSALEKVAESLLSEAAAAEEMPDTRSSRSRAPPAATPNESGSENGGTSSRRSTSAAPPLTSRQSSTNAAKLSGAKGKGSESMRQMTVETETVVSVPHVSLAPTNSTSGSTTSLRTKPSTETIRPKKEKKEKKERRTTHRKQTPVVPGAASSKRDDFEAKLASAIDETNTSDSDETFVYDSEPRRDGERPKGRWHSRTPSATSMMSQADRANMRSIPAVMDAPGPSMTMKRPKFVNTFINTGTDSAISDDDARIGTHRSTNGTGPARGTGRHNLGSNWRRNNGNPHVSSIFDSDLTVPRQLRNGGRESRNSSAGPPSPRHDVRRVIPRGKRPVQIISDMDLDDSTRAADDECTPLLRTNSMRSNAPRRPQPRRVPPRRLESQTYRQNPSLLTRFASCLVLVVMVLLVVSGAIGFMFATSQPLLDLQLVAIKNVVASEQELMLDVIVRAQNPNVVVVAIESADIEVFAKSQYAGSDPERWLSPEEPDENAPNLRLGAILEFDSPLSFEGSFFHGGVSTSTGSARLNDPGNSTDTGTDRWERIIQEEFDLILKGVLKYSLPLSRRVRSASVTGRTTVKPNSASDPIRRNGTEFFA